MFEFSYNALKTVHLLGVIVLLGNVTVTSFWKVFADRTRDPVVIAYAQRLVTVTDWVFTLGGIVLLSIGGFGAARVAGISLVKTPWVAEAEVLFAVSGMIWLFILLPIQFIQARDARSFKEGGSIPLAYRRNSRRWLFWGVVATVPLVRATYVMVTKG